MHPIIFDLNLGFIHLPLHTYGLFIAIGFLLGISVVKKLSVQSKINPDVAADLAFWVLLTGFLGARILFIITRLEYFLQNPFEMIKVWEGGLVFFGGLISSTLFATYYFYKHKLNAWKMIDILLPAVTIAHVFGRFGCLGAGCCYGKPTSLPWGIHLNSELVDEGLRGIPLHPTQLYESSSLFLLFLGLMYIFKRKRFDGQVGLTYFMLYPIIRSIIEIFRGDTIRGFVIDNILSTSQFLSILVFCISGIILNYRMKRTHKKYASKI